MPERIPERAERMGHGYDTERAFGREFGREGQDHRRTEPQFLERPDPHWGDRFDGHDESFERRHPMYPYEQFEAKERDPRGDAREEVRDEPDARSELDRMIQERRPSLSERLENYRIRKLTHEKELDKGLDEYRAMCDPDPLDGRGTEESIDSGRRKSLRERVADFKERRKNSQVRFEDESESMVFKRNGQHRDFLKLLEQESGGQGAMEAETPQRDPRDEPRRRRPTRAAPPERRSTRAPVDRNPREQPRLERHHGAKRAPANDDALSPPRARGSQRRATPDEARSARAGHRALADELTNPSPQREPRDSKLNPQNLESFTRRLSQNRANRERSTESHRKPSGSSSRYSARSVPANKKRDYRIHE